MLRALCNIPSSVRHQWRGCTSSLLDMGSPVHIPTSGPNLTHSLSLLITHPDSLKLAGEALPCRDNLTIVQAALAPPTT